MGKLNSIPPLGNPVTKRGVLAALAKGGVPVVQKAPAGSPNAVEINSLADALATLGLAEAMAPFPDLVLVNVTDTSGVIEKTAATYAWDANAHAGPYTGDMTFSIQPTDTGTDAWVGFTSSDTIGGNTDPNIVGAIYYASNLHSYELAGAGNGPDHGAYSATTNDSFRRVGDSIIFSRDSVDIKTWTVPAATPLYFAIALAVQGSQVTLTSATQP